MKTSLHKIAFLFTFIFGLAATQPVIANHVMAGDLTYTQTAPFTYQVLLRLYRDCNATGVPQMLLDLNAPGCNTGRSIPFTLMGGSQVVNQNCVQLGAPACPVSLFTYQATVTLTAAEQACPDWIFSYTECCRQESENLLNALSGNFYLEAYVKVGAGIQNSSPGISPFQNAVSKIPFSNETVYSIATTDPDCDSVSYELVAPLSAANTPMTYLPVHQSAVSNNLILNPCPNAPYSNPFNPQFAMLTGTAPQHYSPVFPMLSIKKVEWNLPPTGTPQSGQAIWEAPIKFGFDPVTGQLKFVPSYYVVNANPATGVNKWVVEVLVKEWRKLNGVTTLVGTSRREIMFNVVDNGYTNPTIANITANGHSIKSGEIITLRPGMPLNLNFNSDIGCSGQSLATLTSDVADALPGAVFTANTTALPTGTITWSATPDCGGIRFFQVKVESDVCPIKSFQTHTFGVRVSTNAAVTGMAEPLKTAETGLSVFPNPFSSEVKFRFSTATTASQQIFIYNSLGQLIDTLEVSRAEAQQEIVWQKAGSQKSGLYIARLVQNGQPVQTIRFTKVN